MAMPWRLGNLVWLMISFTVAGQHTAAQVYQGTPGYRQGAVTRVEGIRGEQRAAAMAGRRSTAAYAGTEASMVTLPRCHTAQLRGSIGLQSGAAGSIITTLVLRNVGGQTCAIRGYPGVSLVDRAQRQIGRPATWVGSIPVRLVVLRPGGSASTLIRTLNPGTGTTNCLPPSAALRVYPPDEFASLLVPVRLSECLGALEVRPFVAGTSGS